MANQVIDYDSLAQEALRGVVKAVLKRVLRDGIQGDHHFYIAFDTRANGVVLSKRLREQYPEEMTVVLQHRFWDLKVEDDRFEVKLTFDSIPELLGIPYSAIKVFFDPSVPYGLQFEPSGSQGVPGRQAPAIVEFVGGSDDEPSGQALSTDAAENEDHKDPDGLVQQDTSDGHADDANKSADIVELDAFRKK
ncbi:MAG: SspB family protein [Hyphomicrobiaceae bacterium]